MSEEKQKSNKEPFIPIEVRPKVDPDLDKYPPLEPGISKQELQRLASEMLKDTKYEQPGLSDEKLASEMKKVFTRSSDISHTTLDGEAVLLNLENGDYYTLNRIGTVIWELFTDDRTLEEILLSICERFDVKSDLAREDILTLVRRLYEEGLILEKRR